MFDFFVDLTYLENIHQLSGAHDDINQIQHWLR